MRFERAEQGIADSLADLVYNELSRIGLLFRVFSRAKSSDSITKKLENEKYRPEPDEKKVQDLFGVRVALYFPDDEVVAQEALKRAFNWDELSSTIDAPSGATFGPTRCNLVFRLPDDLATQSLVLRTEKRIDSTFEVQIRTVFSEGWHEIEHDLRYKCRNDWGPYSDLDRAMNGLIATLETCDWAIIKLFEDLAWRHYKAKEWLPMIRTKFRLRFQSAGMDSALMAVLNDDNDIARRVFRVERADVLNKVLSKKLDLPVTVDNLIYVANRYFIHSDKIAEITPAPILEELV